MFVIFVSSQDRVKESKIQDAWPTVGQAVVAVSDPKERDNIIWHVLYTFLVSAAGANKIMFSPFVQNYFSSFCLKKGRETVACR